MENQIPIISKEIGPFIITEEIGSGTFASVWKARHRIIESFVAIKVILKSKISSQSKLLRFTREVNFMKQMDHPLIAQLFAIYEDDYYHYLVMEYVENGNLLSYVNKNGKLIDLVARRYFLQIISVLEYLHFEKRVAHRDLKAENIMLDKYFNIRIIDFGLSNSFTEENPNLKTACGSPAYVPPEMVQGNFYTTSADIWSVGVLLYAITVGKLPFEDNTIDKMLENIKNSSPYYPPYLNKTLIDLISKMLDKDPNNRITITKIKEHPWFSQQEYYNINSHIDICKNSNLNNDCLCDLEIINKLEQFNISTKNLKQKLILSEFDDITAIYKLLKKEKIMNEMKNISRPKQLGNTTPNPLLLSSTNLNLLSAKKLGIIQRPNRKNEQNTDQNFLPIRPLIQNNKRLSKDKSSSVKPEF